MTMTIMMMNDGEDDEEENEVEFQFRHCSLKILIFKLTVLRKIVLTTLKITFQFK